MDWEAVRSEFPALARWTYLNSATYGQMPLRAAAAIAQHSTHRDETACTDFLAWYEDAGRIRASIARLINAAPEDIAFVPNAASALAMVLSGIAPAPGDNIVTLDHEFPNYLYQNAAREVTWERFYESVDDRTRLIAFSEVNYSTGFRPPLTDIVRFASDRRVPVFVDGCQSTGALVFDVKKTPVDVLAVHAYKWLLSPTGASFMYVSPSFRAKLPPSVIGWRSHHDWRNVDNLHHGTPEFTASAEKYEGGGLPFHLLYGLAASVDWMNEIGPSLIEERVLALAARIRSMVRDLGADAPETGSQIVCARFPGKEASALARALKVRGVIVSARHGALRIAPHFYNNESDIAQLEAALRT